MNIYTLTDPRDNSVRYVGITEDPYRRGYAHRSIAYKSNPEKNRWVRELKKLGINPILTVIEQIGDKNMARLREQYWIRVYKCQGCSLFNIALPGTQSKDNIGGTLLKQIRLDLGISQESLARHTKTISAKTVKNAENGKRITYNSANQIYEAINGFLEEAGKPSISLEDLGLILY